jgi:hypothetical protein
MPPRNRASAPKTTAAPNTAAAPPEALEETLEPSAEVPGEDAPEPAPQVASAPRVRGDEDTVPARLRPPPPVSSTPVRSAPPEPDVMEGYAALWNTVAQQVSFTLADHANVQKRYRVRAYPGTVLVPAEYVGAVCAQAPQLRTFATRSVPITDE